MKTFALIVCMALVEADIAQQKLTKTFYDFHKTKVKEEFFTNSYGVKNGLYKEYSEYGGILSQGTYKDDIRVGMWNFKDEKGLSTDIETYDMSGVRSGKWVKHCPFNRRIKMVEGNYKEGKKDGPWIEYECSSDPVTTSQTLKSKETYSMDVLNGPCEYLVDIAHWPNKDIKRESGQFKNGNKVEAWKRFDFNSGKIIEQRYYTGKYLGPNVLINITTYYPSGAVESTNCSVFDFNGNVISMIGEEQVFDSTGVLIIKNIWNPDSIKDSRNEAYYMGRREEYYPSGKLQFATDIKIDRGELYKCGKSIFYYESGRKKWEEQRDKNGNFIQGTAIEYSETGPEFGRLVR